MCGCWSNEALRSVSYFGPSDERGCGCNCKRGERLGHNEIQFHSLRARGYDPMAPPYRDQFEHDFGVAARAENEIFSRSLIPNGGESREGRSRGLRKSCRFIEVW
jgi:hypothetical protein